MSRSAALHGRSAGGRSRLGGCPRLAGGVGGIFRGRSASTGTPGTRSPARWPPAPTRHACDSTPNPRLPTRGGPTTFNRRIRHAHLPTGTADQTKRARNTRHPSLTNIGFSIDMRGSELIWRALCSSQYVIPCMAAGASGWPAGRWVVAAARLRAAGQVPGAGGGASARWLTGPAASNTRSPQVRVREKINTPVTRTRRHYPAHGGTTGRRFPGRLRDGPPAVARSDDQARDLRTPARTRHVQPGPVEYTFCDRDRRL